MVELPEIVDADVVLRALKAVGIYSLMPAQVKAVRSGLLSSNRNMVVVAPTGSGKTLIGYMAMLKSLAEGNKGVYLTPLKSIAAEKLEELEVLCKEIGCRPCITTGDYDQPSEWLSECDFIVATYERFDSLLRLKPSWVRTVGTVVMDELHTIGDPERGHVVELVGVRALSEGFRVIGLSAAVGNSEELAEWLKADLVNDDWRPVRLIEGYYDRISKTLVFEDGRAERVLGGLEQYILREAHSQNYQVLIFRHSRQVAEGLARLLANYSKERCLELVEEFSMLDPPRVELENFKYILSKCLAYHHAGLSSTTRKFVEKVFRERRLRAVVATPTLAAGVNLPARRVFVSIRRYEEGYLRAITIAEYKQMAGRAGRPGLDPYGEVVILDARSREEASRYINGVPEAATSVLTSDRALRIHILSLISSMDAETVDELYKILEATLAYRQIGPAIGWRVGQVIRELIGWGMVVQEDDVLKSTKLGRVVTALYVDPVTARIVMEGLVNVKPAYDIYYLTLIAMTPDFSRVRLGSLRSRELTSAMEVLIEEGAIPIPHWIDEYDFLRALKAGMILRDWIEEVKEDTIAERYGIGVGDIAVITDLAQWLLYASGVICDAVGLKEHSSKLLTLSKRVESGVKDDALELVKVRWIGRVRARRLIATGIRTIEDLTKLSPVRLAEILEVGRSQAEEILIYAQRLALEEKQS